MTVTVVERHMTLSVVARRMTLTVMARRMTLTVVARRMTLTVVVKRPHWFDNRGWEMCFRKQGAASNWPHWRVKADKLPYVRLPFYNSNIVHQDLGNRWCYEQMDQKCSCVCNHTMHWITSDKNVQCEQCFHWVSERLTKQVIIH